jgi:methylase of polypeptide subunit release factors
MAIIRKIADQATKHLKKGGCLIMEMGSQQEAIVSQFFLEHPRFSSPRIIADYQGHARVVCSHLLD